MDVRIGTWNLENLYSPDSGTSRQRYEAKLAALAETITELAPDVLAVQEVGDPAALDDLAARLRGNWRSVLADPDRRGIRVGFLSRMAFSDVNQLRGFPAGLAPVQVADDGTTIAGMGRPALVARLELGALPVDLIAVHLKSKLLSYPGERFTPRDEGERARYGVYALSRRAAEAATVRAGVDVLLAGRGQDRAVVVAGDLNDEPQAATTQILLGPGGSELGTHGFARPDAGDAHRLWNLSPLIPNHEQYTRIYRGKGELIDHLLVSHVMVRRAMQVTTGQLPVPSVGDDPSQRKGQPGSDHRPVVATFDL
jgi:endonuclease/exonuclease/phosphatase family metal-dependent hydrolase